MRNLLLLILAIIFYYFIRRLLLDTSEKRDKNHSATTIEDEMVKDPLCNIYILKSEAVKRSVRGKRYYFCSSECAKKFADNRSPN